MRIAVMLGVLLFSRLVPAEQCDLFEAPEYCLGNVIDGSSFQGFRFYGDTGKWVSRASDNSMGVLVEVDVRQGCVFRVRYARVGVEDIESWEGFDNFSSRIRDLYKGDWEKRGRYCFFENELSKIAIYKMSIVLYSKACGGGRKDRNCGDSNFFKLRV